MAALAKPFNAWPSRRKAKLLLTYLLLLGPNLAAWRWAFVAFADQPVLLERAFLAYIFGRPDIVHAWDGVEIRRTTALRFIAGPVGCSCGHARAASFRRSTE